MENNYTAEKINSIAEKHFGIKKLYPMQMVVIQNILTSVFQKEGSNDAEKRDHQIVLLPTGYGKSLCFMIPSLIIEGITLIVYPLISLMKDQERRLKEASISFVTFKGGQTEEERNDNYAKLEKGTKIILANPEILSQEKITEKLKTFSIKHIAIDEAHCVSEWGDTFRPCYKELGTVIKKLGTKTITAFTATASPSVLERISEILFEGDAYITKSDFDRKNIIYSVCHVHEKMPMLARLVLENEKPLIVFSNSRKGCEETAMYLQNFLPHDTVRYYHAGMAKDEKTKVEKWFYPSKDGILCATCAFGMGVDKKDIHTVIHLNPPSTAEAYIQEAGRGGRDGSMSKAILMWNDFDSEKVKDFDETSRYKVLEKFAFSRTCRRQVLLDALQGEKSECSGCDVCEGKSFNYAKDKYYILAFLKKYKRKFTLHELSSILCKNLNRKDLCLCNKFIYEEDNITRVIQRLLDEKKIFTRRGLGKKYISIKNP